MAYERQSGVCPLCDKHFPIDGMEADHVTSCSKGGRTTPENCQMLCGMDNRIKCGK
ncbi:MAG: HNH endonuclease [Gemmobacter sp.]|nr:HNH endonuclease [Gemmobacter sp.]